MKLEFIGIHTDYIWFSYIILHSLKYLKIVKLIKYIDKSINVIYKLVKWLVS